MKKIFLIASVLLLAGCQGRNDFLDAVYRCDRLCDGVCIEYDTDLEEKRQSCIETCFDLYRDTVLNNDSLDNN